MSNNIYDNNHAFDYPNYAFPTEYTVQGQRQLQQQLTSTEHVSSIQNYTTNNQTYPNQSQPNNGSRLNIATLLPLIKAMSNKGKLSTSDMLKTFMPLFGGDSSNMAELIGAFDGLQSSATHKSKIESYTRVDT